MATTVPGPVERHDNDWTSAETAAGRNVGAIASQIAHQTT